jgi:transcriptional regulator with XRE-family HTH domain
LTNLFLERKKKGYSTFALAKLSGVNTTSINYFENAKRDLKESERAKILAVFPGLQAVYLFGNVPD